MNQENSIQDEKQIVRNRCENYLKMPESLRGQIELEKLVDLERGEKGGKRAITGLTLGIGTIGLGEYISITPGYENVGRIIGTFGCAISLITIGYLARVSSR